MLRVTQDKGVGNLNFENPPAQRHGASCSMVRRGRWTLVGFDHRLGLNNLYTWRFRVRSKEDMSRMSMDTTRTIELITPLKTTHEPPGRDLDNRGYADAAQ